MKSINRILKQVDDGWDALRGCISRNEESLRDKDILAKLLVGLDNACGNM